MCYEACLAPMGWYWYKASFRYKYNRVRQRSMVELYLNMQNKRKADGVIDIEIAQNPLKTVFMTAL